MRGGALLWVLILLLLTGVAAWVADRQGPWRGWIAHARQARQRAPPSPAEPPPAPVPAPSPVPEPSAVPEPAVHTPLEAPEAAPEPSPRETRYAELYTAEMARLPPPVTGREYSLALRGGDRASGRLLERAEGRLTFATDYGRITYPIHRVSPKEYPRFFIERVARERALRALRKEEAAAAAGPRSPLTADAEDDGTAAANGTAPAVTDPEPPRPPGADGGGEVRFDPTPAPTPEELQPALQAFARWLGFQHRHLGAKVMESAYAKRQGDAVVLYLVATPVFLAHDYDLRYRLTDGLAQFWGLRCQDLHLVGDPRRAYIVLLDGRGRIVGGSEPASGVSVWAEEAGQLQRQTAAGRP